MSIRNILSPIFSNKTQAPAESLQSAPMFKIIESAQVKNDFEVTEISWEEYINYVSKERRSSQQYVAYNRRSHSASF